MAENIKLKNGEGEEITWANVPKIKVPAADGSGDVVYQLPPALQEKSVSITENGTSEVTPDEGYDGLSKVGVTVKVPKPVTQYTLRDSDYYRAETDSTLAIGLNADGDWGAALLNSVDSDIYPDALPLLRFTIFKQTGTAGGSYYHPLENMTVAELMNEVLRSSESITVTVTPETYASLTVTPGWWDIDYTVETSGSAITVTVSAVEQITDPSSLTFSVYWTAYGDENYRYAYTAEATQQIKTVTVTENGTQTINPDTGKSGLTAVKLHVDVPTPPEEARTVVLSMASGDQVVNPTAEGKVMTQVTIQKPDTLAAGNIKKDVNIGGVVGTYAGEGGGGGSTEGGVRFYDYDGTLLYTWPLSELASKTELPALPTHEGLTAQGWNWSLDDLQSENAEMNVGAMYTTSDGKTHIYITLQEGGTSPILGLAANGTVTVDWGDDTTTDTLTGTSLTDVVWTPTHNYAAAGSYVIKLTASGTMSFVGRIISGTNSSTCILQYSETAGDGRNRVYQTAVMKVAFGANVEIGDYALSGCPSLAAVSIPNTVTSIGTDAFRGCCGLASIVIPDGVTETGVRALYGCYNLAAVSIPSTVTSIDESTFFSCYGLSSITIYDGVTSIGQGAFRACYGLSSIAIPSSVTSIADTAFQDCYGLSSITIHDGVTSIGRSAFYGCYGLSSITIPSSVTSIGGGAFRNCYGLSSIIIPDSVTSIGDGVLQNCVCLSSFIFPGSLTGVPSSVLSGCTSLSAVVLPPSATEINVSAFYNCTALSSITMPDSLEFIYNAAFQDCSGAGFFNFTSCTSVPSLESPLIGTLRTFSGTSGEIRVPADLYDEWVEADNWSTYADQIVAV